MPHSFDRRNVTTQLTEWIAASGVTRDELAIIQALWYAAMHPSVLVRVAMASSRQPDGGPPLTHAHACSGIRLLLERRLVRAVDGPALRSYGRRRDAEADRVFWVEGAPPADTIEFTRRGGIVAVSLYENVFVWSDQTPISMVVASSGGRCEILTTNREFAARHIRNLEEEWGTTLTVRSVSDTGPWRDRPWRCYQGGYRLQLEEGPVVDRSGQAHGGKP